MIVKRSGKISAVLFVLWVATMLWVLDTRVNFTHRTTKENGCLCAARAANQTPTARKDTPSKVKTRTIVKWLTYCKEGNVTAPGEAKAEVPPKRPEIVPKRDELRKQSDAKRSDQIRQQDEVQKQGEARLQEQQQLQQEAHQQQQHETRHEQQQQSQEKEQPQEEKKHLQKLQEIQQQEPPRREQEQQEQKRREDQKEVDQQFQTGQQQLVSGQDAARNILWQQVSLEPSASGKVINPHPFTFTMKNSEACVNSANSDGYVDVLCLVYTAPSDSYMRSLIRKTWASAKEVKGKRIVTMFLLGKRNLEVQQLIELENNLYHDIIQEDFTDSYYNLTIKTVMGLKWVAYYCPNARFIVKMDIDMFVNVYNLIDRIETAPTYGFAEGNRKDVTKPIRYKQSKWYTSKDVYPADAYPPYLNGPAYLMSADLAARIYKTSFDTQFLPWEDAFVGIIMKKINVDPKYNGKYDTYLNYTNQKQTLQKIGGSITFHLGEDKDKNKVNIVKVWEYVRQLNHLPV